MTKRVADMTPEQHAERKAYAAAWRKAHPASTSAASRKYQVGNQKYKRKKRERYAIWMKSNPEKVRAGRKRYKTRVREKAKMNAATNISQIELFRLANAAVPRGLIDRDYVVSDIVMAVLEYKLMAADIPKRASEFIRAYNRDNDHFKTVSLNECLPGTDLARIDTITKDDLPW